MADPGIRRGAAPRPDPLSVFLAGLNRRCAAREPAPPAPEANPKRVTEAKGTGGAPKPKPEKAKSDAGKTGAVTAAKAESDAQPSPPPDAKEADPGPKARFVKFLYEDACRRFGTVLGPEANAAHKDHFHLDMKTRRRGFCE